MTPTELDELMARLDKLNPIGPDGKAGLWLAKQEIQAWYDKELARDARHHDLWVTFEERVRTGLLDGGHRGSSFDHLVTATLDAIMPTVIAVDEHTWDPQDKEG